MNIGKHLGILITILSIVLIKHFSLFEQHPVDKILKHKSNKVVLPKTNSVPLLNLFH